jgi:signal transduction histidine kinase
VSARIAWCVVGLCLVAVGVDTAFTAAHAPLMSEQTWAGHGWPLLGLAGLGCALMGALILSRHPGHRLGWLLCAGSLISVTMATEAYSVAVLSGDVSGSAYWAHVSGWVSSLLGWPAFTAVVLVFLLAPDGHLLSQRWRWVVWVTVAGLGLHTAGTMSIDPGEFVYGEQYGARGVSQPLLVVGVTLVAVGLGASAVSMVMRLRRARDDARRQLLWIASSAAALAFGVAVVLAVPQVQGAEKSWLAALPLHLAYFAFPLAVAVAVLRHRLLEIDLIVNRALVLAMATGVAAVGYVLVVVLVGLLVEGSTRGFWPSLFATVCVALAFQPLRRGLVRVADRLSFGAAAVPYETLADFSRRLEDSADSIDLLPAVAEAAGHAVGARRATALLHVETGADRTARWPMEGPIDAAGSVVEMPVLHRGERLGSITVGMPAGRALRPREHRLLADLAEQAGLAFRNARLTAELSGQVEQLDLRNEELAGSRRRLITAGDAERSRLERSIARQVVPHLTPLPDRLDNLVLRATHAQDLDPESMVPLVDSLNDALEALREITRGVFPAQLERSGLQPALVSLVAHSAERVRLEVDTSALGRWDPSVEAAAYFCVVESLNQGAVAVAVEVRDDALRVMVTGVHGDGSTLGHMRDRVEAAGGSVTWSTQGGGSDVDVRLPATPPEACHSSVSSSGPKSDLVT